MHGIVKRICKAAAAFLTAATVSCVSTDHLVSEMDSLEQRITALESAVSAINSNALAISALLDEGIAILSIKSVEDGYTIELSDGRIIKVTEGLKSKGTVPVIGIDADGNWIVSYDDGKTFEKIQSEASPTPEDGLTPQIRVSEEGYWEYSFDQGKTWQKFIGSDGRPVSAVDGKEVAGKKTFFEDIKYQEGDDIITFVLADGRSVSIVVLKDFHLEVIGHTDRRWICLGETVNYEVSSSNVSELALRVPKGWEASFSNNILSVTAPQDGIAGIFSIGMTAVSSNGYVVVREIAFTLNPVRLDETSCKEWNDFVAGNEDNVLLDFSFAGYDHGETAPADAWSMGYRIFDVTGYGAVADDGKSDREAFLAAVSDAIGGGYTIGEDNSITFTHKEKADAIIYFPEGEFILHDSSDDADGKSRSIIVRSGNIILKGAGREKTRIVMKNEMLPLDESVLYSSPDMLQFKHNSSYSSFAVPAAVTGNAPKGSYSVTVSSAASITPGDWVCLNVRNSDPDFIAQELAPYTADGSWSIVKDGVEVIDYHQVKSVDGNTVTFVEPLMHAVDANRGWEIKSYPHYENVGIEDLTFVGNAKPDFIHHQSWKDDGGFKPVSMTRLVNSWIRRVGFESVSEACSIIASSNVSAYDIIMTGNRGHAAVRSQASSRVLIAATQDMTSDNAGNFHGTGVSKQSIGTVLWRNRWGDDSCFESHATQPRATLIDCCTGGWMRGRQGGDATEAPHHLDDLVIWNFDATGTDKSGQTDYSGFTWWETTWWRFLPPVIVGFRSDFDIIFVADQAKVISSQEMHVNPESLYEAQLRHRLGSVPAWINTLK